MLRCEYCAKKCSSYRSLTEHKFRIHQECDRCQEIIQVECEKFRHHVPTSDDLWRLVVEEHNNFHCYSSSEGEETSDSDSTEEESSDEESSDETGGLYESFCRSLKKK